MTLRGGTKSGGLLFVLSLAVVLSLVGVVSFGMVGSERGVAPAVEQGQSDAAEAVFPDEVQDATADQQPVISSAAQQDVQPATADTAPAGESEVIPPDQPGPYHVGYYSAKYEVKRWGTYFATIRYPAKSNGHLAAPDAEKGPYPGIVIGPSYATLEWWSTWNAKHLASHGYVTISFTLPYPVWPDVSQSAAGYNGGIDKLKAENGRASSPIAGLVDVQKFGVTGLSMGGSGCIEAAGTNPEVDCAVALAPGGTDMDLSGALEKAAQNIKIPIQLQVGTNDAILALMAHGVDYYYSLIPDTTPKEYVEIEGANHVGFVDAFYAKVAMGLLLDKQCLIGIEEQHRISEKHFTSWFNYFLKGKHEYGTYIFGAEAQKDVSAGVLSQFKNNVP